MITGLMKNNLTQKLATGAAALGVLAGVGLVGAPAQAGKFTLAPRNQPIPPLPTDGNATNAYQDSEWGFIPGQPNLEPIWSTWPNATTPGAGIPAGSNAGEGCRHGLTQCVNGWDNPLVTYAGPGDGTFKIEYFGSGTATQTNNFLWNGVSLFGPQTGPGSVNGETCQNVFGNPCGNPVFVPAVSGALPFQFTTNLPVPGVTVNNGDPAIGFTPDGRNVAGAHYFATLKGTWADLTDSNVVYLGFSDGNGGVGAADDDAADYVIKITSVKAPEPGTVLGLLAFGGLGALMKRKKQG